MRQSRFRFATSLITALACGLFIVNSAYAGFQLATKRETPEMQEQAKQKALAEKRLADRQAAAKAEIKKAQDEAMAAAKAQAEAEAFTKAEAKAEAQAAAKAKALAEAKAKAKAQAAAKVKALALEQKRAKEMMEKPSTTFALTAKLGEYGNNTLTLYGVSTVMQFPKRAGGPSSEVTLPQFIDFWDAEQDSFTKETMPVAKLTIYTQRGGRNVILDVEQIERHGDSIVMQTKQVQGKMSESFKLATLFLHLKDTDGIAITRHEPVKQKSTPTKTMEQTSSTVTTYALTSMAGRLKDGRLHLDHLPTVMAFTNEANTPSQLISTDDFVAMWKKNEANYRKAPAKTILTVYTQQGAYNAIVELYNPKLNGDSLSFATDIKQGILPAGFKLSTLFMKVDNDQ